MKTKTALRFLFLVTLIVALFCPSCIVVHHKNGKSRGWNKNPNNPHHPHSSNPGKGKPK
jgi:hypothetical protein